MMQPEICTTRNLTEFFHESLARIASDQHLELEEELLWYLTQLLCTYSRSENFFDYHADGGTLTPLADYYRHATEASSQREARLYLQRLGDVSLFVSGLYSGIFRRRSININYYMSMGQSAYSTLAHSRTASKGDKALNDIFSALAEQYGDVAGIMMQLKADDSGSMVADPQATADSAELSMRSVEPLTVRH